MQGLASAESLEALGGNLIGQPSLRQDLAKSGKINLLRQGILHADAVSTVSPTYAKEITAAEFGEGLEADLNKLDNIYGNLNGLDESVWNPATDRLLAKPYDKSAPELKLQNKSALQKLLGLKSADDVPLIGIVSRLTGQKGFDLLEPISKALTTLDFQMIILGVGEPAIENFFADLCRKHPQRFTLQKKFDERLAHQIYAGADIFLMPSRFEPCGLGQMIAMRYGSLPLVRSTGGLKDTVINLADNLSNADFATGFVFDDYDPLALLAELKRALNLYHQDQKIWDRMSQNAMAKDLSWANSAKKYSELYQKIINS